LTLQLESSRNIPDIQPELQILRDPYDDRWLSWITTNPQANFFHHPAWMSLIAECYRYQPFIITLCNGKEEILAGLPMMEIKNLFSDRRWVSLPFTDYCEPLYDDRDSLNLLVDGLVVLFQNNKIAKIELRFELPANQSVWPQLQYAWHTLALDRDFDRVAKGFDRVHRQNVRQAENHHIRVKWGNQLEDVRAYYELQLETRRRHGVPAQPWRFFRLFGERLVNNGYSSILLAYKGDRCIAGLVLLHWQHIIICKYAASKEETMNLRPNNLLFWTAIQWGCENGYTFFDFGRSDLDNPGLCRFKRGWGAKEIPLTYQMISKKPEKVVSGKLLRLVKPFIQRSPHWVCQMAGELLYKYSG
jgi:CelD/BcsL family acetyltransferase involved in cellulose biosynthesis